MSSCRVKAKILNILNFAADATLSMKNWGLHDTSKFLYEEFIVK